MRHRFFCQKHQGGLYGKRSRKQIFQVVCVVHDLDTALANWKRLVDFRQSSIKDISVDCTGMYHSRRIQFRMKAVRFDLGGIRHEAGGAVDKDGATPMPTSYVRKGRASSTWVSIRRICRICWDSLPPPATLPSMRRAHPRGAISCSISRTRRAL